MKHIIHIIIAILIIAFIAGILGFPAGQAMTSKEIAQTFLFIFFIIALWFLCCRHHRSNWSWFRRK